MNADFVLGQLRLALTAFIAYAGGRGWFTPADSTLALAMLTSLGPLIAPWLLSVYSNFGTKRVPKDSVAVAPYHSPSSLNGENPVPPSSVGASAVVTGKIVGALLLALILFAPGDANAQSRIVTAVADIRTTIIADLTAARDDARADDDPSAECWAILLDRATRMPPKLMGVAHTVQRARSLRRALPTILDKCAIVKDGARQALLTIFGAAAGGITGLVALGL